MRGWKILNRFWHNGVATHNRACLDCGNVVIGAGQAMSFEDVSSICWWCEAAKANKDKEAVARTGQPMVSSSQVQSVTAGNEYQRPIPNLRLFAEQWAANAITNG